MRGKKLAAGILVVTVLVYGIPGWTAAAPIAKTSFAADKEGLEAEEDLALASSSDAESTWDEKNITLATSGNAEKEDRKDDIKEDRETETSKENAVNVVNIKASRDYGMDGEYQLEAEDGSIASYESPNVLNGDGNRVELQQNGSVTYDLSQITDFKAGKYVVFVNMNGNSTKVKILVNDNEKGLIEKDNSGWDYADLKEYCYNRIDLEPGDRLKIMEGEGQYTHLDWVKLTRLDADYWLEAEDSSVASFSGGGTQIHGDGDRVEVNSGGSVTFDFSGASGFVPGTYDVYAGVNGARTQWGITIDGETADTMDSLGNGKFQRGSCVDVSLGTGIELSEGSTIQLADMDGSWGHVDYLRLVKTDEGGTPVTPPEPPTPPEANPDGEYQLEAENGSIASYESPDKLNDDGSRVELQQNGSVTYDLNKITDFRAGNYLLIVRMNGNSTTIRLLVDGGEKGTISKESKGFESADLEEYSFHGALEFQGTETITIQEGEGEYTHLDWIKLVPVEHWLWIEAEDTSVADYAGGTDTKIHGDGDRVEIGGGAKITFDFSRVNDFASGIYELYAGVNGARAQWKVTVDDKEIGNIPGLGDGGKWAKGTCVERTLGMEIELSASSKLTLADVDGSWGHVDYLRLVRTGDLTPKFDETDEATGIRVTAPQGYFPDGTTIETESISSSVRKEIREEFKAFDPGLKVFFYRFSLNIPKSSRARLLNEENELEGADERVIVYLPLPEGYSRDCDLYFASEPGEELELMTGTWIEGQKLCFSMETNGGMYVIADENLWRFEGEDYYQPWTDGGRAADLQPGETITFSLPDDEALESGSYNFIMRVCGGQNYTLLFNGKEIGSVTREGSDWGDYKICTSSEPLKLSRGGRFALKADDNYGWVDYICLTPVRAFSDEQEGVLIEAAKGVVPLNAEFSVIPAGEEVKESIRGLFGFAEESTPAMSFYTFSLQLDGDEIQPSGEIKMAIPVPEDFVSTAEERAHRAAYTEKDMSLYRIKEDERKVKTPFTLTQGGTYVEFSLKEMGIYGLINRTMEDEFQYPAVNYYDRTTGDYGQYADLQPGDQLSIPVKDIQAFADGNYLLSVHSSGNRTKFMVLVNDVPVGMLSRQPSDWEDMNTCQLSRVLSLTQDDVITIYAPGLADAGPYGWVDFIELKETDKEPAPLPAEKTKITLEAEDFYPDELEADGAVANLNNPLKKVEFPILAADGFVEKDYHFTLYTTGTMKNWAVYVNGMQVLSGSRDGSGYEMRYMTKEIGGSLIHLKPGDILSVQFMEQESDNYGNWVDKIILNSRRKIAGEDFLARTGGRISVDMVKNVETVKLTKTTVVDGKLIYQGEAYYQAQSDNPAADLQPGEQILIPVSDHHQFAEGMYRLAVRSCGNREIFRVKVNGWTVGTITRKETSYGMNEMTEDNLGVMIALKPGDVLAIEGQTGGKYGWVDYVSLSRVSSLTAAAGSSAGRTYSWEGEDFYMKQKDHPAADLQPGEEIVIPLNSNSEFVEGTYYLAAVSNGNRTAMVIKKNGERIGSIARNETNFAMDSMTMDVLQRPITLSPGDVISICAPGDESGPYGWVDKMILMPFETSRPQEQNQEELRYPAWAYGTASLYLPAADLQPGEALHIPLMDNPSFVEGQYRIAVLSNGTREQFAVLVNGQSVGNISREPSDYGDNGMSSDKLEQILYLKPSDVITIVGQEGDFYGWVSALALEPIE